MVAILAWSLIYGWAFYLGIRYLTAPSEDDQ